MDTQNTIPDSAHYFVDTGASGSISQNIYFPPEALERIRQRKQLAFKAAEFSRQVHWGEQRKITKTRFYDDHIRFVAGGLGHVYEGQNFTPPGSPVKDPSLNDDFAVAGAFLHDTVENAGKLADRIRLALDRELKKTPRQRFADPAAFLSAYVPPLFHDFMHRRYEPDWNHMTERERVNALRLHIYSTSKKRHAETKRDFRLFVTREIFANFGAEMDQLVYILTRHPPADFIGVHTISAKGLLDDFGRQFAAYKARNDKKLFSAFMHEALGFQPDAHGRCRGTGNELARYLAQSHGLDPSAPMHQTEALLESIALPEKRRALKRSFGKFSALQMLEDPAVLGDRCHDPGWKKLRGDTRLKQLLTEGGPGQLSNIDKIYGTGFTDRRSKATAMLLPIAATIKCFDIVHNLCTLDYGSEEELAHARKVIRRTDYLMPYLEEAGAGPAVLAFAHLALKRANTNLRDACAITITPLKSKYDLLREREAVRPGGSLHFMRQALKTSPGTRRPPALQAA